MSPTPARSESWEDWARHLSRILDDLSEGDWVTVTPRVVSSTAAPDGDRHATSSRRRRRRGRTARTADVDVFVQARPIEGVIALECVGDTEFEGLSDLSSPQLEALVELGWQRYEQEPDLVATFAREQATAAADLVTRTLRDVVGVVQASDVDIRRPGP
jgi:hypothetical protein